MSTNNNSKRSISKKVLWIALVILIIVGITWAYLTAVTTPLTNVFTFEQDLTAQLLEPNWDTTDTDSDGIPDASQNLTPTKIVVKDPQVLNDSAISEYVAIRFTIKDGSGTQLNAADTTKLLGLITFGHAAYATPGDPTSGFGTTPTVTTGFDTTNWVNFSGANTSQQIWYYNKDYSPATTKQGEVKAAERTTPLFTHVTINRTISDADFKWLRETLGGFQIYVEAAAVQADSFADVEAAKTDLAGLFPTTP